MERSAQESVLVVVEGDAACPLWLNHWGPAPTDDWSMLEQEEGEAQAQFSDRVTIHPEPGGARGRERQ